MCQGITNEIMKHFQEEIKAQPQYAKVHYQLYLLLGCG